MTFNLSVPFQRIVCEFGPVWSGPFREIVDPWKVGYLKSGHIYVSYRRKPITFCSSDEDFAVVVSIVIRL